MEPAFFIKFQSSLLPVLFVFLCRSSVVAVPEAEATMANLFGCLWLVAGTDLLWEKSTAGWLVADDWC